MLGKQCNYPSKQTRMVQLQADVEKSECQDKQQGEHICLDMRTKISEYTIWGSNSTIKLHPMLIVMPKVIREIFT